MSCNLMIALLKKNILTTIRITIIIKKILKYVFTFFTNNHFNNLNPFPFFSVIGHRTSSYHDNK